MVRHIFVDVFCDALNWSKVELSCLLKKKKKRRIKDKHFVLERTRYSKKNGGKRMKFPGVTL